MGSLCQLFEELLPQFLEYLYGKWEESYWLVLLYDTCTYLFLTLRG